MQQGIRDFEAKSAEAHGIAPQAPDTPITDVMQRHADALTAESKSVFKEIESLTKVNPTTLKQNMAARALKITDAYASGNEELAGNLEQMQIADEERGLQAFKDAKAQNPKLDVETARNNWNDSLRADEASAAIRASKSNTSTLKNIDLDPNKLTPRLQKLMESQPGGKAAKLPQISGVDNATALTETAENARIAMQEIKDFVPSSATGQQALAKILRDSTTEKVGLFSKKTTGVTNWNVAVKKLGDLPPDIQKTAFPGEDLEKVRIYLGEQARRQNRLSLLKTVGVVGAGGVVSEEIVRHAVR
ncbi:MAG: hypothetical protein ACHQLQ_11660 [Candidatus Acidiferrales bacterium]